MMTASMKEKTLGEAEDNSTGTIRGQGANPWEAFHGQRVALPRLYDVAAARQADAARGRLAAPHGRPPAIPRTPRRHDRWRRPLRGPEHVLLVRQFRHLA